MLLFVLSICFSMFSAQLFFIFAIGWKSLIFSELKKNEGEYVCARDQSAPCLFSSRFFSIFDSVRTRPQQLGLWTQKIQANIDYCCCVWRREETRRVLFARPRTQASEPALTDSSLAARDVRRRFTWRITQPSIRAQHDD